MLCLDQQLCLPEREALNYVTYSMSVWCPFFITCCKIAALLPPKTSNFALHKLIQCLDNKCKWPSCCLSYAKHSRSVYPSYNTSTFRWVLLPPGWFAVTASANTEVFFMQMRLKDQLVHCMCAFVCVLYVGVCVTENPLIPYGMPHIVTVAVPAHSFDFVQEKIIISPFTWNSLSGGERDR